MTEEQAKELANKYYKLFGYTERAYSYFVDATTGEIIGGHTMDYIYSESR